MKKVLIILLVLSLFIPHTFAAEGLVVETTFGTTQISQGIHNINGKEYYPLMAVSEALGAVTYENELKNSMFIISRDGDTASHTVGNTFYVFNGSVMQMSYPSVYDEQYGILVPPEMIKTMFVVKIEGNRIIRDMYTNFYNGLVSNLLQYCIYGDFYPENFVRYYSFYCKNPDMDPGIVINSVNIGLDKTWHSDAVIAENTDSKQVLVNKLNRLPENYEAKNLVPVGTLYMKYRNSGYMLDAEAYYKYVEMYDAAAKEGIYLKMVSAYRTEDYQRNLYNSYVRNYGQAYAEKYSAQPGYSEHQTGLAVDINSLYTSFENSKEYAWLKQHAHEYGFIERYKKGREYITGYAYEPWHYRYVGTEAAKIIHDTNMTYEEYCAVYLYKSEYSLDKDRVWAKVLQIFHK